MYKKIQLIFKQLKTPSYFYIHSKDQKADTRNI